MADMTSLQAPRIEEMSLQAQRVEEMLLQAPIEDVAAKRKVGTDHTPHPMAVHPVAVPSRVIIKLGIEIANKTRLVFTPKTWVKTRLQALRGSAKSFIYGLVQAQNAI
jgi:hypothetical protein